MREVYFMSRKKIIILVALALIILGVWVYQAYKNNQSGEPGATKSILSSLFPFGNSNTGDRDEPTIGTTGSENPDTETPNTPTGPKRLIRLSDKVVAGATVLPPPVEGTPQYSINDPDGNPIPISKVPIVRFAERGTGYLYDIDINGQNGKKTSGTVLSRTAEAYFGDGGETIVFRYIKDDNQSVATYLGRRVAPTITTSDGTVKGEFLPDNIVDITFSTDGKNILFLLPTGNGVAGISMKSDGTAKKQLFSSSFSEWLLDWTSGTPVLTTKATALLPGQTYLIPKSGVFQKIAGGINGMTTKISPDGKSLIYNVSGGAGLTLHIKRLSDGSDINVGLQTLPEKCIWAKNSLVFYCAASKTVTRGDYPDSWYQGVAHFNDSFWKIDASTGIMYEISNGEGNNLDATRLSLDSTETYLVFIDKNTENLWALNMGELRN